MNKKDLAIIGAGPYGLAVGAYARKLGLDFAIYGSSMGFWRDNMPSDLVLRSPSDWHIDSVGNGNFEDFLETKGINPREVDPIPAQLFLAYSEWFQARNSLDPTPHFVSKLNSNNSGFELGLDNGESILAANVVVTSGLYDFRHIPSEIAAIIPAENLSHACETVDFQALRDKDVLVIGGRMTAFEWAVLMKEQANAQAHIVHRHDTPVFKPSDFSWMYPEVANTTNIRGWFRNLSTERQKKIAERFYFEGRLKMEPWLEPKLNSGGIEIKPNSNVRSCELQADGKLLIGLDDGATMAIDHVILATGYKLDITKVPFLIGGNVLDSLQVEENSPVLDEDFQSNLPGLFFTGISAVRDFGPYFGFVVGSPSAGQVIGNKLERIVNKQDN